MNKQETPKNSQRRNKVCSQRIRNQFVIIFPSSNTESWSSAHNILTKDYFHSGILYPDKLTFKSEWQRTFSGMKKILKCISKELLQDVLHHHKGINLQSGRLRIQGSGNSTQRRERRIPLLTEETVTEQLCRWSKEQPVQTETEQQETLGQMSYGGEEMKLIDYWRCLIVLRSTCNSMEELGKN